MVDRKPTDRRRRRRRRRQQRADDEGSEGDGTRTLLFAPPATATEFFHDMHAILRVHSYGPSKSFCHKRLNLTEQKFSLHVMLNADREFMAQKEAPHRDFYNVRKVDTHVHHSACMNQKHLLRFIKSKLKREPHEQVIYRDGKFLNLREVFESINLSSYDLNVDTLDMHADKNTFHRFDRFNLKYNPCGQSRLREVFIKQDNLIRGRFLAEVTKEVISDLEAAKYQMAEYRISIYGRRAAEWDTLASWVLNNRIFSNNVVWLIQLPRLYNIYRGQGTVQNFQQMLDNIFQPLFEVTVDPSSHPALHHFLQLVVGFDMVDDESKPERRPSKHMRTPEEWDVPHNPAFAYYAYYVYANLYTLNKLRESKGLNTISFRPHAGEAGDIDHLAAAFLLTKNIAHGINLRKSPVLQYLYYLEQIGLNMSPLSNNSLFLDYHRNPFPVYFARGLRVTLSTDDPLQIHMTKEPLVEEYSVAASVWKLSAADLCEIARNSVLNSDFPHEDKQHWVSDSYWLPGPSGNDMKKTNVPNIRVQFRNDVLAAERALVAAGVAQATRSRARGTTCLNLKLAVNTKVYQSRLGLFHQSFHPSRTSCLHILKRFIATSKQTAPGGPPTPGGVDSSAPQTPASSAPARTRARRCVAARATANRFARGTPPKPPPPPRSWRSSSTRPCPRRRPIARGRGAKRRRPRSTAGARIPPVQSSSSSAKPAVEFSVPWGCSPEASPRTTSG